MYLHLSGYGESTWKPLVWLALAVFCLFPVLYGWAGVISDGYLVEISLTAAALLPTPEGTELTLAARILQVVERIIAPFLALLFTLAVRRRFRR